MISDKSRGRKRSGSGICVAGIIKGFLLFYPSLLRLAQIYNLNLRALRQPIAYCLPEDDLKGKALPLPVHSLPKWH